MFGSETIRGKLVHEMTALLTYSIVGISLAAAIFALWHVIRGYQFSNPLFYTITGVEVALILGGIAAFLGSVRGSGDGDPVLFWSYFATTLIIAPLAVVWAVGDKSRWGTGVVVIAMITIAVLVIRLGQIWQGHG